MSFSPTHEQPEQRSGYDGSYVIAEGSEEAFDLIVGGHVTCPKGSWEIDGVGIPTGPNGLKAILMMHTARHGVVRWDKSGDKSFPIVGGLKPYELCDPSREKLADGLDPYTIVECVIDGNLGTFTACSWGCRKSFKRDVVDQWRKLHPFEYPVITLGVKPPDANGNVAPAFVIESWVPASKFGGPGKPPQLEQPIDPGVKRLQEVPANLEAMMAEANAPLTKGKAEIHSGRDWSAPDDVTYAGPGPGDEIIHDVT
jgi:hypothetical protein